MNNTVAYNGTELITTVKTFYGTGPSYDNHYYGMLVKHFVSIELKGITLCSHTCLGRDSL